MRVGAPPSARMSQRQVIAFLPPDLCARLKDAAQSRGLTLREMLATAVNAELAAMGIGPVLTPERQRRFRRVNGAAAPRGEKCHTLGRRERTAVAGWFDRKEAEALRGVSTEVGRTVQDIAESGCRRLVEEQGSGDTEHQPIAADAVAAAPVG